MTQVVIPSEVEEISAGQIGKIQEDLGAALRKSGLPRNPVQQIIETQSADLTAEFVNSLRRRIEAVSNLIVRRATVNRKLLPQESLDATGRKQHTNQKVVDAMPRGEAEEVELVYFKPRPEAYDRHGYMSPAKLQAEYDFFRLGPDPQAQAADNAANPTFADEEPNACQWKDAEGNWCYAVFDRWYVEREVYVDRGDDDWDGVFRRFAGVRK